MLYSMLDEEDLGDVTDADIRKAYGLLEKIPKSIEGKIELGRNMAVQNQKYIDASSPFALPAAIFAELAAKAVETKTAVDGQAKEILDVYHMNKMLAMERKRGDRLLSRGFKWLVARWDDDDERLFAFGFVPKSAIWTEGDPEPGENPWPNKLTGLNAEINILGHASVKADVQTGAASYNFYVAESMINDPIPDKPFEATWRKVSQPSIMDTKHTPGTIKTYWACGIDENGVEGEFCDPVSVKFI